MNTWIVARRLIKQISRDRRSMALMFLAPVFVLFLLYVVLTSSTSTPVIAVVSVPEPFIDALDDHAEVVQVKSKAAAIDDLQEQNVDAYVTFERHFPVVMLEGTDPQTNRLVLASLKKAASSVIAGQAPRPVIHYFYGSEDFSTFDSLAPVLMGFFIFFFVFIISGISFLRERLSGTLERMLATPLRRGEIVAGYFLGFGLFVALQTVLVQSFIVYALDVPMVGNFWWLLVLNLLIATVSLSLGLFLSAFAGNEFQLFQFIPLVIVPQVFFSGLFDLSEAPKWVDVLSDILPLTYAAEGLRDIMLRGLGVNEVKIPFAVLAAYSVFFLSLNTLALKKYRKV